MQEFTIRQAESKDVNEISELLRNNYPIPHLLTPKDVTESLKDKSVRYIVAIENNKVVGYAQLSFFGDLGNKIPYEYCIHSIVVDGNHRKKGIGNALFKEVFDYSLEQNAPIITIGSILRYEATQKFAVNNDFQPYGAWLGCFNRKNPESESFIMYMRINQNIFESPEQQVFLLPEYKELFSKAYQNLNIERKINICEKGITPEREAEVERSVLEEGCDMLRTIFGENMQEKVKKKLSERPYIFMEVEVPVNESLGIEELKEFKQMGFTAAGARPWIENGKIVDKLVMAKLWPDNVVDSSNFKIYSEKGEKGREIVQLVYDNYLSQRKK